MGTQEWKTLTAKRPDQQVAVSSPLRLEIIGLFTDDKPLAISDMALLMGRPAGSLYYHVEILEYAGLLERKGTRPKGKRFETLFLPTGHRLEVAAEPGNRSADLALRTISSAFRMAERDMAACLERDDLETEGPGRDILAYRAHLRASPELLAGINAHLDGIQDLLKAEAERGLNPSPADKHVSLTLALLPLKGRTSQVKPEGKPDE